VEDSSVELTVLDDTADRLVIRVAGEIDMTTAPMVVSFVRRRLPGAARTLVLDLDGVTFFGSAGLNVLLTLRGELRASGAALRIVAGSKAVLRPLEVTGLTRLFRIVPAMPDSVTRGTVTRGPAEAG
jgi:anti-sigma B factor antagonist